VEIKIAMKYFLSGIGLSLLLIASFAFKTGVYEIKKSSAEVEQEEGVYVFYRAKPVAEYEYLGTYKIGMVWDDKPRLLFNKLVRKTKEKFPNADGIIIDNDMGKCDAIKFK
jgi:hypothetical protein